MSALYRFVIPIFYCAFSLVQGAINVLPPTRITQNTTWSDTLRMSGDVIVEDGILTVEPGTHVWMGDPDGNQSSNPVFDVWHVALVMTGQGAIHAVGTEEQPITFQKYTPGGFGTVKFEALERDSLCILKYCRLIDGFRTIEFRNPANNPDEPSRVTIDHCLLTRTEMKTRELMYVTGGGLPQISNCIFENSGAGIFFHGGGTDVNISYTVFRNLSCAVFGSSMDPWYDMQVSYDHCLFYNISGFEFASQPVGNGFGHISANRAGKVNVHNTVFAKIYRSGIRDYNITDDNFSVNWEWTNDYNCFYDCGEGGSYNDEIPVGGHSMEETDPMFNQPDSGDYSLMPDSPLIDAASDGTHIGPWQGIVGIDRYTETFRTGPAPVLGANPFGASLRVHFANNVTGDLTVNDAYGTALVRLPVRGTGLTWNGRDADGRDCPDGLYYLSLQTGGGSCVIPAVRIR